MCVFSFALAISAVGVAPSSATAQELRLRDVAVAPGASVAVVATESGLVLALDAADGEVRGRTDLGVEVDAIGLAHEGQKVAVVTTAGDVLVFNPLDGEARSRCSAALQARTSGKGHSDNVVVEFDPSGARVLVAALGRGTTLLSSSGRVLWRWDGATNGPWGKNDHRYGARLSWDHEHDRVAVATETGFEVIDAGTGEVITTERVRNEPPMPLRFESPADIFSLAFDGTRNMVYAGHCDCRLRAYDLATGEVAVLHTYARPLMGLPEFAYGRSPERSEDFQVYLWTEFAKLSLSPDGKKLGYSTTENVSVGIFDLVSRSRLASFDTYAGSMGIPGRIAWSEDSSRLFFTSPDSKAIRFVKSTSEGASPQKPEATSAIAPPTFFGEQGVAISSQRVFGVDAKTGRLTWSKAIERLR